MSHRCRCGRPLDHVHEQLGCIECGRACCPACSVTLESAAYCAPCAAALVEASGR